MSSNNNDTRSTVSSFPFIDCSYHLDGLKDHIRSQGAEGRASEAEIRHWLMGHANRTEICCWLTGDFTEICPQTDFDAVLAAGFTWDHLVATLREKVRVLWLSQKTFVTIAKGLIDLPDRGWIVTDPMPYTVHGDLDVQTGDPETSHCPVRVCTVTSEEPTEDWVKLFQLLAQTPQLESVQFIGFPEEGETIEIGGVLTPVQVITNFPLKSTTLERCLSILDDPNIALVFQQTIFEEDHSRALASFRGGLEFCMMCTASDGYRHLLEAITKNEGPRGLTWSSRTMIDGPSLLSCVRRTTSMEVLSFRDCGFGFGVNIFELVSAIKENCELKQFSFHLDRPIPECLWMEMMQTLLKHPTLERLNFGMSILSIDPEDEKSDVEEADEEEEEKEEEAEEEEVDAGHYIHRARAVADTLTPNTTLYELTVGRLVICKGGDDDDDHTYHWRDQLDPDVFNEDIQPRLQANLFRKRIKATIQAGDGVAQERQLLSELLSAHNEGTQSLTWMSLLVSSFRDLIVSSLRPPDAEQDGTGGSDEEENSGKSSSTSN